MDELELGLYWRVSKEDWDNYFEGVIDQGDFFLYGDYYYIRDSEYDTEYDQIAAKGLFDYVQEFDYLGSSIHFGE